MQEVIKVTLSSGKEVLLKSMKISHLENAERVAGSMSGMAFIKALSQQLIAQVDGKKLKPVELEQIDDVFTVAEFMQVIQVVGKCMGDAGTTDPQVETVFGEQ